MSLNHKQDSEYDVYIAFDPTDSPEEVAEIKARLQKITPDEAQYTRLLELLDKELSAAVARKIPLEAAQQLEEKYLSIGILVEIKEIDQPIVRKLVLEPQEPASEPEEDTLSITEPAEDNSTPAFMIDDSPENTTAQAKPAETVQTEINAPTRVPPMIHKKITSDTPSFDDSEEWEEDEMVLKPSKHVAKAKQKKSPPVALWAILTLLLVGGAFVLGRYLFPVATESALAETTPESPTPKTKPAPSKPKIDSSQHSFDKNSADSLVYISQQNRGQRQYVDNVTTLFLLNTSLNPEQQTLQSPLLHMPQQIKDHLLLKYIDTLLNLGQIERADELYRHAKESWSNLTQSEYGRQANIHILAYEAIQSSDPISTTALQKVIDNIAEEDKKIEAWLFVMQVAARHGVSSETYVKTVQPLLDELQKRDDKKAEYFNSLLNIHQAEAFFEQARQAQHNGRWGEVGRIYDSLAKMNIQPKSALNTFVVNMLRYQLAQSLNRSAQAKEAQQHLLGASSKLETLQESRQALLYWQEYTTQLDASLNTAILQQLEPIIATRLAVDEEALILSQICQKMDDKACLNRIGNRAFDDANIPPMLVNHFGLQNLFNYTLSNAQQAYQQADMTEAENWLERGVYELF